MKNRYKDYPKTHPLPQDAQMINCIFLHSATKFKCNFAVIDVVHSGIKMGGTYFIDFRWDENCCNSLHRYKDYPKTHPLPQDAQMINCIFLHSATKFKCNFAVIDVVHSGIKMSGTEVIDFRWDENCCNSLHRYKDYPKINPLPQYVQMINCIPITKCPPPPHIHTHKMVLWRRVAQHARDVKEWRNGVQSKDNIVSSFTWNYTFKACVVMKLVPYHGVLAKESIGEILKEFKQVSGSAVDESFLNQFEWTSCANVPR